MHRPARYSRRDTTPQDRAKCLSYVMLTAAQPASIRVREQEKSTLLKILSRVTEPKTGRVDLYGRVAPLLEVGWAYMGLTLGDTGNSLGVGQPSHAT